jgi:DNA processing protein
MSMALDDNVRDLLALQLTPGLGPRLTTALLERFGSARRVLSATATELCTVPQIGERLADKLVRAMAGVNVAAELELLERHQSRLLVLGTPDYPCALASLEDAPHLLYVRGTVRLQDANAVAIVGSRHCTNYGRRVAARLAAGLVRAGVTIISGLARGIDGMAQEAALKAGGRTIAVLAGGLSRIYPPEHADLAKAIEASGALLSEASMDQDPQAGMFPARNRIISGLSRAVVIVEAGERSGALITASHAAEQGRTVFAVPGAIDNPASAGANALIRDGAILARGPDDILEELLGVSALASRSRTAGPAPSAAPQAAAPPPDLDPTQRRIWDFLAAEPRTLDDMAQQLALAVPLLSTTLMLLEMRKLVRRLPGNRYERFG